MERRRLRILAIGYANSTHVVNRVRCFADRGHDVFLLSRPAAGLFGIVELTPAERPGQDEWVMGAARAASLVSTRRLIGMASTLRLLLDFRRLVRRTNPDVIHVHYAYSLWAWLAAALALRPLVVSIMGGDVLFQEQGTPTPRGISLTKRLLRAADLITSKSDFLIGVLNDMGGFGKKAIRVVWGVDPEQFRPLDGSALRLELGLPADARIILSPKILQPFYNIDIIVEALAKVVIQKPKAHLVVTEYGADPTYRAELVRRIDALGLSRNVTFVGKITHEQMPRYYAIADLSVGIPKSDGLPQTLLEAMACGVPNIVGRLARYDEIVRDGESAIFVDITPDDVAEAILRLLGDEELRRSIVARGRELVIAQANFPRDVKRIEDVYYRLAEQKSRNGPPRIRMLLDIALYCMTGR